MMSASAAAAHPAPNPSAVQLYRATRELGPELCCPITCDALQHPVRVGAAGKQLYSEDALLQWARHSATDPVTRAPLCGEVLLREPAATAAINALRRGAAALCHAEGDWATEQALLADADRSEREAALRPLPRPLPQAMPSVGPSEGRGDLEAGAHLALRLGMACVVGGWMGLSLQNWWIGQVPPEPLRTAAAAASVIRGVDFMMGWPGTRTALAFAATYASASALAVWIPASAHLFGFAVGVGVLVC